MEQRVQNGNAGKVQRTVRSEEQILSLLEEFETSGYTVKEYCEVSDVNEATLYSWLKKYCPRAEGEEMKGFARVELVPSLGPSSGPTLFAEVGAIRIYREVTADFLKSLL